MKTTRILEPRKIKNLVKKINDSENIFDTIKIFLKKNKDYFLEEKAFEARKDCTEIYNEDFKNGKTIKIYKKAPVKDLNVIEFDYIENDYIDNGFNQIIGLCLYLY